MDPGSVKLFAGGDFPRLRYIADLLLNDILGLTWELVTDRRKLGKHPVINYSAEEIPGSFKITPSGLLQETGVKKQVIGVSKWNNLPVFFQRQERSDFPFDIFAASFYLVTRYEEYFAEDQDKYGRFRSSDSLAARNGFLHLPVVELWTRELANALVRKYQYMSFRRTEFRSLMTIDADESFRFQGMGVKRTITGFISDIAGGKGKASMRFTSITKGGTDPYDVFDYILESLGKNRSAARFFIPVGDPSEFDQNPSWKSENYRSLIRKISSSYETGIHLSFKSARSLRRLRMEVRRFGDILGNEARINRFHYLRFSFPVSFRNLVLSGIREDYSMGYPDQPGFRAGISHPFRFYDLHEDTVCPLLITPFQFMDAMFFGQDRNDPDAALEAVTRLDEQVRKAGGTIASIWHNTTLLGNDEGQKWRKVFEYSLNTQAG